MHKHRTNVSRTSLTRSFKGLVLIVWICVVGKRAKADQMTVEWTSLDGIPVIYTLIDLPRPITQAHLDSLQFKTTLAGGNASSLSPSATGGVDLVPTVTFGTLLSEESRSPVAPPLIGLNAPDWSGGSVSVTPLTVASCAITSGSFGGLVVRGQSFFVSISNAMTLAAGMSVLKGDPDLYLTDLFGNTICASTALGKNPENCYAVQVACLNDSLTAEVYGTSKKNSFQLAIWITSAS